MVGIVLRPDAPAVRVHDRPADREPKSEAVWLRGHEWLEHGVDPVRSYAGTTVGHRDAHRILFVGARDEKNSIGWLIVDHRVAGVHDEIEHHLLNLYAVGGNGMKPSAQIDER